METVSIPRQELIYAKVTYNPVSDVLVSHTRWSVWHRIVFAWQGKYLQTEYAVGATESQEMQLWETEDLVKCVVVELKEVTKKEWVQV